MLINLSNHPSAGWNSEQTLKAEEIYGEICDYPFPAVPTDYDSHDVAAMADRIVGDIIEKRNGVKEIDTNLDTSLFTKITFGRNGCSDRLTPKWQLLQLLSIFRRNGCSER